MVRNLLASLLRGAEPVEVEAAVPPAPEAEPKPAAETERPGERVDTAGVADAGDRAREMRVTDAAHVLCVGLGDRGVVQSRGPVGPLDRVDVAVLVPRDDHFTGLPHGPGPDRVLLALTVTEADGTAPTLRPLAAAGVEELWVLDAAAGVLQVHRGCDPTGYGESRFLGPDEPVNPLAFPDLVFRGADFFA